MIERFSLEGINRKSAIFDSTKLEWMNGQYLNALSAAELEPLVSRVSSRTVGPAQRHWIHGVIGTCSLSIC